MEIPVLNVEQIVSADKQGSSWPLRVVAGGKQWILKSHGAAQGPGVLVAERICSSLARTLGLSVPEHVILNLPAGTPSLDNNDELADHIQRSVGMNLGVEILDPVSQFQPADIDRVDVATQSAILWLDGLVQNGDRTASNTNMLWSRNKLWLIDFGAALPFQYSSSPVTEDMPFAPGTYLSEHVFREAAGGDEWGDYDEMFATCITREVLKGAVASAPPQWLLRQAELYETFLWKRLKWPRAFTILTNPAAAKPRVIPDWLRSFSRNS